MYIALSAFHTIDGVASVFEELLAMHATSPKIRLHTLRAS
jgi:hypothetical protein